MRKILGLFMAIIMFTLSVSPLRGIAKENKAIISDELLQHIGCSEESLLNGTFENTDDTFSCVVWIEDIDYEPLVKKAITEAYKKNGFEFDESQLPYNVLYGENGDKIVNTDFSLDEEAEVISTYIDVKRSETVNNYLEHNNNFIKENINKQVDYVSRYSPCIFLEATLNDIYSLVYNNRVSCIDYYNKSVIVSDCASELTDTDIDNLHTEKMEITNINITKQLYGVSGYNVKIGQFEPACPSSSNVNKNINALGDSIYVTYSDYYRNQVHADTIYQIMHEIAPNATYYASGIKTENGFNVFASIEWLLDQNVNVINMSACFLNPDESPLNPNQYDLYCKWFDHITFNHDVHMVNAAGNFGSQGVASPAMAYNVITVGNVYSSGSFSRYFDSSYNATPIVAPNFSAHKPDIMAPGYYPSGTNGTSLSAPMITATIALMGNMWPATLTKQHLVKNALMTGTGANTRRYVTNDSTYYKEYGAGILDARSAFYIINNSRYLSLTSLSQQGSTYQYLFTVGSTSAEIRCGLYFSNRVVFPSGYDHTLITGVPNNTIAEMAIAVIAPNGQTVVSMSVPHTNVQIVQFDPALYGTGTYTIRVTLISPASNNQITSFSICWR